MAYQALYRKYRPQTFKEVYGQKPVVQTLENTFKDNKISHAYLFCGPRGTGKTSMARLFAKALNCEEGLGHQCCKCKSCIAIANGDHPDVVEMDAASNSGVNDVRSLISQVSYQPIMGRYKVYIIDEVHNMSPEAFNALLKTLEEPPANVVFILATTEPQKILPTILSRVQRFDFSKVSDQDLIADMNHILDKEGVKYEEQAVSKIASLADGGVRDALSLLDQAISYCDEKITEEDVEKLFGLISVDSLVSLLLLAHENKVSELINKAREFYARGMDIVRANKDLVNIYKDLILKKMGGSDALLKVLKANQVSSLMPLSLREIEKNIDILIKTQRDFKTSSDLMDTFELGLLEISIQGDQKEPVVSTSVKEIATPVVSPAPKKVEQPIKVEKSASVSQPFKLEEKRQAPVTEEPTLEETSPVQAEPTPEKEFLELTDDQIINLMLQGDKELRVSMAENWDNLVFGKMKPELKAAANIAHLGIPSVVNKEGLLIVTTLNMDAKRIDDLALQEQLRDVIYSLFGVRPQVAAIPSSRYKEVLGKFKTLLVSKTLPAKKPIIFYKEKPKKKSNADLFLEGLKEEK